MSSIFLVVKVGVYRHNIHGAFTNSNMAVACGVNLCKAEHDDYHEYEICQLEENKQVDDCIVIATVKRNDPVRTKYVASEDQNRWLKVFYSDGTIKELEIGNEYPL